jgi:transcriptional repressor NrdR
MRCPYCHNNNDKVVNSRSCQEGEAIRRRRECLDCGKRFTTFEYIEMAEMHVIKSNGQRETFNREKIRRGVALACEKRPVSAEEVDTVVQNIEREVQNRMDSEIKGTEIGEMVLKALRDLDEVAYIRFASVYRSFRDASAFRDEALNLLQKD